MFWIIFGVVIVVALFCAGVGVIFGADPEGRGGTQAMILLAFAALAFIGDLIALLVHLIA